MQGGGHGRRDAERNGDLTTAYKSIRVDGAAEVQLGFRIVF
jgi:hypothetical protein